MSKYFLIEPAAEPTPAEPSPDYGNVYSQILLKLTEIEVDTSSIAASLITMALNSTTIAANSTILAEKLTAIETYQKRVKELGEGPGFRIKSPYEIFSMVAIYKLFIEEGKIFDFEKIITEQEKSAALAEVIQYMQKINTNIPKEF